MSNVFLFHVCQVLSFLSLVSASHVLVAGNEEAFRSLAKNFVPQKLANQLASLMTEATARFDGGDQQQYYEDKENPQYDEEKQEYVTNDYDYDQGVAQNREYEQPRSLVRKTTPQTTPKPTRMQVNLDELVEKVKDRIMIDLQTTPDRPRLKAYSPRQQNEGEGEGNTPLRTGKKRPEGSVNRPSQFKKKAKKPTEEIIENNDFYEKVKLSRGKGKKDSYEDYVIPKKEDNIYEPANGKKAKRDRSVEIDRENHRERFNEQNEERYKKRPRDSPDEYKRPERERETERETENYNRKPTEDYNRKPTEDYNRRPSEDYNRKPTEDYNRETTDYVRQKSDNYDRQTTEGYERQSKENFNRQSSKRYSRQTTSAYDDYGNRKVRKSTQRTTRVEYVDDDYNTHVSTVEHEPKALTEFIGGDYKDEPMPHRATERTPGGYQNTKRKYKKIATNMAVRERYTINTPNYYEKLNPKVAEKYNFDEPLPEKDREEENLKPMWNPPAAINGKIKI